MDGAAGARSIGLGGAAEFDKAFVDLRPGCVVEDLMVEIEVHDQAGRGVGERHAIVVEQRIEVGAAQAGGEGVAPGLAGGGGAGVVGIGPGELGAERLEVAREALVGAAGMDGEEVRPTSMLVR